MSATTYTARHAMGRRVVGQALVASDGFSARYDLNRLQGVFSRPAHKLVGQSYVDRILVLDTAKGGVATAWLVTMYRFPGRRLFEWALLLPLAVGWILPAYNGAVPHLQRQAA